MSGKLEPYLQPTSHVRPVNVQTAQRQRHALPLSTNETLTCDTDGARRSGRATKGQHSKESSSPAPKSKPAKSGKKSTKKATSQAPSEEDSEEDVIRCICGDDNEKDKRAFIGCDACQVWQHNVCMGMPEDDDDVPDHYFCEECRSEEHQETIQALERGEKIWETRLGIWKKEKKMSKQRKSKGGVEAKPGWLKKDVPAEKEEEVEEKAEESPVPAPVAERESQETGSKRKREIKQEVEQPPAPQPSEPAPEPEQKPTRLSRQDKRRKSSAVDSKVQPDPETAIVPIDQLPSDRQKIAKALSNVITEDISDRAKSGYRIPDGDTPKSLGELHASRIEYALTMNHGGPKDAAYGQQFRNLNANLKRNKMLVEQLLSGALTADELAVMPSSEMASEEQQKERAAMKAEADRQSTIIQSEQGPKYRRTHKGDEIIEDEGTSTEAPISRPVRQSMDAEMGGMDAPTRPTGYPEQIGGGGSPTQANASRPSMSVETSRPSDAGIERRQSSQNFDMNNIWAKTAQSPTQPTGPRPMQMPPRRRSSGQPRNDQQDGAKDDPDIDRMLQDDEETYSPADFGSEDIVWRGKVVQTSDEAAPTVNARFVAGRDVSETVPWKQLLPEKLNIDGRLQIPKAEEYLCGLQWSTSSDVAVLALTPYDDAKTFDGVFEYFKSRDRYAVVNRDKPAMVKDLYIIPVDVGAKLPDHVEMLEHCTVKQPVEERLLLATFVVARAPGSPPVARSQEATPREQQPAQVANGHLPQHVRASVAQGPAGSPLNTSGPTFSPSNGLPGNAAPVAGYGAAAPGPAASPFPPNPYGPPQAQEQPGGQYPPPTQQPGPPQGPGGQYPMPAPVTSQNPLVGEVLGGLQFAPTAQQILMAEPGIGREKLENLRHILESNPEARTDIQALASRLMG